MIPAVSTGLPFARLVKINKPEWKQAVIGVASSAALGLQMPGTMVVDFSSFFHSPLENSPCSFLHHLQRSLLLWLVLWASSLSLLLTLSAMVAKNGLASMLVSVSAAGFLACFRFVITNTVNFIRKPLSICLNDVFYILLLHCCRAGALASWVRI